MYTIYVFPRISLAQRCPASVKSSSSEETVPVVSWSARGTIRLIVSSSPRLRKDTDLIVKSGKKHETTLNDYKTFVATK